MSKRALLVGINDFQGREDWRLNGCVNDTLDMQALLTENYSFDSENVRLLNDRDATGSGIRNGLNWLLSDYDGDGRDVRVFHFASHGTQVADQSGDEYECIDEVIVPFDHDWINPFRDDELKDMFATIPANVHFTFVADCCHSGSIQRFVLSPTEGEPERECRNRSLRPPVEIDQEITALMQKRETEFDAFASSQLADILKDTPQEQWQETMRNFMTQSRQTFKQNKFNVVQVDRHVLIAACEDRQTAADAFIEGQYRGAFTWSITKTLRESNGNIGYGDLIQTASLHLTNYTQKPQLECPVELKEKVVFGT